LYLDVPSGLSSPEPPTEENLVRTESRTSASPAAAPAARRRLRRLGLTAGTLVAAWVAAGAPIHLGMITDMLP
jgi:hypothetical protein